MDEDATRDRWRCKNFAIVDYCEPKDRGPEPSRLRLLRRCQKIAPKIEGGKFKPTLEYRKGGT